jgi:hypothetical protein
MLRVARTRARHDFDGKEQGARVEGYHWLIAVYVRRARRAVCLSYPFLSPTMTAPPTEETRPQTVPIDDENDVDDSDEEGAPEIAAADGQFHLLSVPTHHILINLCLIDLGEVKKKKKKKKPKKKKKVEQGDPPRTGLSKMYPDGKYPVGEIQEYKNE